MEKCNAKGVWLMDPQIGTKSIGFRWIYKNKYKLDGGNDKHKEMLVTKGYV